MPTDYSFFNLFGEKSHFDAILVETDQAFKDARLSGADKICPAEFQQAVAMRDQAVEIFYSCSPKAGEELLRTAHQKAEGLCPRSARLMDADGDGIPDSLDNCVDIPEDMDGVRDEDGCPDRDNGHEPDNAEASEVKEERELPPTVKSGFEEWNPREPRFRKIRKEIGFARDSVEFSATSFVVLDQTAEFLRKNPAVSMIIEGHTSDEGPSEYNQKLSLRRAQVVKNYLTWKHGINPDRLGAVGYGEEQPMAPNDTEEGRAENRRIEFVIINGNLPDETHAK